MKGGVACLSEVQDNLPENHCACSGNAADSLPDNSKNTQNIFDYA